jgi:hypothetical protein
VLFVLAISFSLVKATMPMLLGCHRIGRFRPAPPEYRQ